MTGRLYIDGHDAYDEYGVYVEQGGWNELLSMPSLKTIQYNDWQEEDGIEPDLSAPKVDKTEATVKFAVYDFYGRFQKLMELITDGAYHTFKCSYIGRTYRLRLVSVGSYTENQNMVKVAMKFANDYPTTGSPLFVGDAYTIAEDILVLSRIIPESTYVIGLVRNSSTVYRYLGTVQGWQEDTSKTVDIGYAVRWNNVLYVWDGEEWVNMPDGGIGTNTNYTLDGVPFSEYGIRILKGTLATIKKQPDVKMNLQRNISIQHGATYDPQNVTFKAKDITLYCLLTSPYLIGAWYQYDRLLADLCQPGERTLYVEELEKELPCYYKSGKVTEFFPDESKVWLRFTLTLTLTGDFRLDMDDVLLASESSIVVYTEDDENAIDLSND